ncbi:hypothetical protein [Methyloceanibacter stevinii]|uniref:hypothetical protein n=1 Tax=Methyloceanibacter stevinii TaxID=1774970 RepID=UPI0019D3C532|nr:hypothetical protein [Methyloceanibacter stevinii]
MNGPVHGIRGAVRNRLEALLRRGVEHVDRIVSGICKPATDKVLIRTFLKHYFLTNLHLPSDLVSEVLLLPPLVARNGAEWMDTPAPRGILACQLAYDLRIDITL